MAFLKEFSDVKMKMLQAFLSDRDIVTHLTSDATHALPAVDLRYKQVFPYPWVDDTVSEAKAFLSFDVYVQSVETIAVKTLNLVVWVFAHSAVAMTNQGVRVDLISNRVDELINGSQDYGFGKVALVSVLPYAPNNNYYGRVLRYQVQNWNRFGDKL
jgi:hypothetical protein